ncbi:MAG: GNAT family protein [Thermaerobacter sp.]|nr:GNAT family protein [Thermaerobacter sp.]
MFTCPLAGDAYLRILEGHDAEALFDLTDRSRAHLRRWMPWLDQTVSPEHTAAFIAAGLRQFADGLGFQAGIWRGGTLLGVAGLHPIDWPNRQSSLGYWLGAGNEGQGLVTMACRALLDTAFADYGLHRMELRAATGNTRSRAVAERLSFTLEGVVRDAEWLYDRYVDHAVYGLLVRDWTR